MLLSGNLTVTSVCLILIYIHLSINITIRLSVHLYIPLSRCRPMYPLAYLPTYLHKLSMPLSMDLLVDVSMYLFLSISMSAAISTYVYMYVYMRVRVHVRTFTFCCMCILTCPQYVLKERYTCLTVGWPPTRQTKNSDSGESRSARKTDALQAADFLFESGPITIPGNRPTTDDYKLLVATLHNTCES